jgi:DNA-binding NarL/FixJ family response regulator
MLQILVIHRVRLTCDLMAAALQQEKDVMAVDYACDADEALARLQNKSYDVLLVNINLADNDALRLTRTVARMHCRTKIIITGLVQSKAAVLRCIEEGAAGYVLEEDSFSDLIKKIHAVTMNRFAVAPSIGGALIARLAELKRQVVEIRSLMATEAVTQPNELTPREWEILGLIEQGLSNQEIANALVIELGTVKNHVHNILRKLDVQNRKHAVVFARQLLAKGAPEKENNRFAPFLARERAISHHSAIAMQSKLNPQFAAA